MTWKELRFRLCIMMVLVLVLYVVWFGEEAYFNTFRPLTAILLGLNLLWAWRLHRLIQRIDKRVGL